LTIIATKESTQPARVFSTKTSKHKLGYSTAARNFISVFDETPPELDAITLKAVLKTKSATIALASEGVAKAALAITAGEGFFWYWLVRGDGFDVTGWVVRSYKRSAISARERGISASPVADRGTLSASGA
jgi:hypothetical protein